MRCGIFALAGAATLSVAACGTSNKTTPAQSATPTSAASSPTQAPAQGNEQKVAGLIASVTGNTIQVTQRNGNATVDFTPSTRVSEVTSAGLPDVTAGSCITVRPTKENPQSGGAITAASVRVSPAVDGKCPQPKEPPAGSTTPAPPGAPSGPSTAPPPKNPGIQGTVASVAGNTITVNTTHPGSTPQTTVTVSDRTKYTKEGATNSQAIAQGKCITAQGTEGSGGALQATTIRLRPAADGKCPGGGGPQHGQGG
jgi:Domain of unknown function (DUF5666)